MSVYLIYHPSLNGRSQQWHRRDLNTQPSDLESDTLPLRHEATLKINFALLTSSNLFLAKTIWYFICLTILSGLKDYQSRMIMQAPQNNVLGILVHFLFNFKHKRKRYAFLYDVDEVSAYTFHKDFQTP